MKISKQSFFGAALGTMIEYYDYALFIIFMPIISPVFFPSNSAYDSLGKMYTILLFAMLARPLGAIFFGHIGDFIGRKKALLLSMYGIAGATLIIGITPSAEIIGIAAAVIVTLVKATQVFCFGGEFNGAGVYVVEHAQNQKEALAASLLAAMTSTGSLLASLVAVIFTLPSMPSWMWRIAFIMGGIIGLFGILYRKKMLEVPNFKHADSKQHGLMQMLKNYPREMLAGMLIGGLSCSAITTILVFLNPVLMTKGYFNSHQMMLIHTIIIGLAIITIVLVGLIADKITPIKIMRSTCLLFLVFTYPILMMIDHGNLFWIITALCLITMLNEMFLAPALAYLKNLFPMQYRYRACSLSFCLGMSIFGGITPVVDNYLYKTTQHFSSVSIFLIGLALATYLTLIPRSYANNVLTIQNI